MQRIAGFNTGLAPLSVRRNAKPHTAGVVASKVVGYRAAKLLAQQRAEVLPNDIKGFYDYYANKFGGEIPSHLREELDWAVNRWPELFTTLLKKDILPFDITICARGTVDTIVEFFRDELKIDDWLNEKIQSDLGREVEYLETSPYGALLRRGLDYYMSLFERRPELLPIARPSLVMTLRLKGRALKKEARSLRDDYPRPMRTELPLVRPGFTCEYSYRIRHSCGEKELPDFYRQSWASFKKPAKAIEYLLAGGEMSQALRWDTVSGLHGLVRRINYGQIDPELLFGWMGDGCRLEDRPFLSVTTEADLFPVMGGEGNLFLKIRSDRAFFSTGLFKALSEREFLIPFALNPAEIVEAKLVLPDQTVVLPFNWSSDYTQLEVAGGHYKYDEAGRKYV